LTLTGVTGLSPFPRRGGGRLAVVGDKGGFKFVFVADMVVQERKCKASARRQQGYLAPACSDSPKARQVHSLLGHVDLITFAIAANDDGEIP